jgi:phosphate transport system protein
MSKRLTKEIGDLKERILALGAEVEDRVRLAVVSIHGRDAALAARVIDGDRAIDAMEVDLEEECLKVLALHQPMAVDLRTIVAVLKIDNDLERIGDLAVNIAERAVNLAALPPFTMPFTFDDMASLTQDMLRKSLDALVFVDADAALAVCEEDEKVDAAHRGMYGILRREVEEDPARLDYLTHLMNVSRYLERIADHATNIAEDVIYLAQGEIVRHHARELRDRPPRAPGPATSGQV